MQGQRGPGIVLFFHQCFLMIFLLLCSSANSPLLPRSLPSAVLKAAKNGLIFFIWPKQIGLHKNEVVTEWMIILSVLLVLILQPPQGTEWVCGGDCRGIGQETVCVCPLLLLSTPHDLPLCLAVPLARTRVCFSSTQEKDFARLPTQF